MKKIFLNKALRILLATNAMIIVAAAMLGPIYALFVKDIGGDLLDASIAGGILALVAGITTLTSGKYSDKIKENELIIVLGYTIMGVGFLLYFWVNSVTFLFIVQAVIGFGEAIYAPAFDAVYSKHLDEHKSGTQWGVWESMNYFTHAMGAFLGGVLVTVFGFQSLFIIMAMLCFGSALYIFHLKRSVL
ncbi:MAG: MFS transporter [Candidatus Marinimicrobia bacterium]|jgi:predicted MFS family arabinose efflux permease|nr:MFS transporter [Candidatus Neomarinimicrobiota bacterium]|tara:strand:+ start:177 stop:743 length:567 start_codon:yes stop_codon:yes gene_type:complete